MVPLAPAYEPHLLEQEAQTVWKARQLPPSGGILGSADGPVVRQFEGTFTPEEAACLVAHRAVAADVDARYLALAGRRAVGTLRSVVTLTAETGSTVGSVLQRLGVWTGGNGAVPWDSDERMHGVEAMVGRLAHRGVLVSRDLPLRVCPSCATPRTPERIIYQEEEGDTYLVRFDLAWNDQVVHALVWIDAPWRLLGTSAILLHPELPYVIARYRRKDVDELVLTSRSSVERFRSWIPGASLEVVEEHPGRFFEGRPYNYPLRNEFPTGGALASPAGTVIAVTDVTDTGTGIVPLVPGHGSTDAAIAEARGVAGWPLVTPRGQLDLTLMHKYAGLDLRTGNDFIVRDLTENGAIFAHLRVRRGVPHCAVCGIALFWMPGRAWCLEPGRLPSDRLELYRRLLPGAPVPSRVEVAPWPVSETERTTDAGAVALLECSRCERLEAMDGPVACPCGGKRYPVRRRLLPSIKGTLAAWARHDPFPVTDSVRLYVGERRRVPVVVHQLMAMSGLVGAIGDVGLTLLPTVTQVDLAKLVETEGADAVRAALVRAGTGDGASGTFAERCAQERERLTRFWSLAQDVLANCDPAMIAAFTQPVGNSLGELEAEDRALLARWERTRVHALADFDHWVPASVHRRVFRFIETDLAEYREWVRPRLTLKGTPTTKRSALRTLVHVLRSASVLLGPILPHLSEAVHRRLANERSSIFEGVVAGADRALLNDDLFAAWDRWSSLIGAVGRFRRKNGLSPQTLLPSAVVLLAADDLADQFRADRPVLERLAGVGRLDVGSPREPWTGRHRQVRPVESEIQRYYPSQATQIFHLLQRMPARKLQEDGAAAELSVVVQGLPRRIFPSMVEYTDTLPPRMVPCPWPRGEMYLELPEGEKPPDRVPPPLSSDAFWLVRKLDHRLSGATLDPSAPPRVALIWASDPLASELRGAAEGLSRYLGLHELRVLSNVAEAPPPGRWTGRTRTGARWWVHVPGLRVPPPRPKHRPSRSRSPRVPVGPPELKTPETDYLSAELLAHEQAVRALGLELDELIGAPLLGPTKVARAWDRGFTSVEQYRRATFDAFADLPGFGYGVAGALVMKLGGTAPAPRSRAPRTPAQRPRSPDGHPSVPDGSGTPRPPPQSATASGPRAPILPSAVPRSPSRSSVPKPVTPALPHPAHRAPSPSEERTTEPAPTAGPPEKADVPLPPPTTSPGLVELPTEHLPEAGAIRTPDTPPEERIRGFPGREPVPPTDATLAEGDPTLLSATEPTAEPLGVPEPTPGLPTESERVPEPTQEAPSRTPGPALEPSEATVLEAAASEGKPVEEAPSDRATGAPPGGPILTEPPSETASGELAGRSETLVSELPPEDLTSGAKGLRITSLPPDSPSPEPPTAERAEGISLVPPIPEPVQPIPGSGHEVVSPSSDGSGAPPPDAVGPPTEPISLDGLPVEIPLPEVAQSVEVEGTEAIPPHLLDEEPRVEVAAPETLPDGLLARTVELPEPAAGSQIVPPTLAEDETAEPALPPPEPTSSGVELELGTSILTSIQPFLDATAAGHRGVCVARESPERITAQVGSRPVDVYWLTNLGRGKTLKPNDLAGLLAFLARALEEDHVMAFFIEGIEYLVRIHGAEALVDRLAEFDRLAREHDARVWVHVTRDLLAASDFERIVAAFGAKTESD